MAYIPQQEDDDTQGGMNSPQAAQQPDQQDAVQISGSSASVGAEQSQMGPQTPASPDSGSQAAIAQADSRAPQGGRRRRQKGSGAFQNIRQYVRANQPAAQRLSESVGGAVTNKARAIGQQLESQRDRFERLIQGQEATIEGAKQFTQQARQKAGTATSDLQDFDFQRYQDIASGRTRFDLVEPPEFQKQKREVGRLGSLLEGAQKAQGREKLLRQSFGQQTPYTVGQQAIDSLILAANPDLAEGLGASAQAPVQALQSQLDQARAESLEDLYGIRSASAALSGREGSAYQQVAGDEGLRTQLQADLDARVAQELARRGDIQGSINQKIATGQFLTNDEFDMLGVPEQDRGTLQALITTKSGAQGRYGLQKYLSPIDQASVNRMTVANPDEVERYAGLSRLLGEEGLAQGPQRASMFDFDTAAAINDALNQINAGNVRYVQGQGIVGETGPLQALQNALLTANPFLAAPVFATQELAQMVGSDPLGAVTDATALGDELLGTALTINPFELDQATKNIIGAGGNVIQTAGDIAQKLTPDAIPGTQVVDAFIGGGTGAVTNVVNEARRAAEAAARAATRVLCFVADTPIRLENGNEKFVQDLVEGDMTYLGGAVVGAGFAYAPQIYEFKGLKVSPDHGFFVNGQWKRAYEVGKLVIDRPTKVYPIVTQKHLLVANDIISSDTMEIDDSYSYSTDEALEVLNQDIERNNWLSKVQEELNENKKIRKERLQDNRKVG